MYVQILILMGINANFVQYFNYSSQLSLLHMHTVVEIDKGRVH